MHPMKALFLIPKTDPPSLEGNFSKYLKDFVKTCCKKEQTERPSVKDLLRHKFIRNAKKTSSLEELISARYVEPNLDDPEGGEGGDDEDDEKEGRGTSNTNEDWEFTIQKGGGIPGGPPAKTATLEKKVVAKDDEDDPDGGLAGSGSDTDEDGDKSGGDEGGTVKQAKKKDDKANLRGAFNNDGKASGTSSLSVSTSAASTHSLPSIYANPDAPQSPSVNGGDNGTSPRTPKTPKTPKTRARSGQARGDDDDSGSSSDDDEDAMVGTIKRPSKTKREHALSTDSPFVGAPMG
jgi:serine/threonine-protein kinase 24/25/MST4